MKEYFIDFFKLLANCVMVVCFAFVSFLIIINFYHHSDINNAYDPMIKENKGYIDYQKTLKLVDKKMKSVDISGVNKDNARVIFHEYEICKEEIAKGSFSKLNENFLVKTKDIYDYNSEILNNYNSKCTFGIPYDMKALYKTSFADTYKKIEEKRELLLDSSDSLVKSQLGNSSYSFSTFVTRSTIYDKVGIDFKVTLDNYKLMASILNDIADWYVAENGGAD